MGPSRSTQRQERCASCARVEEPISPDGQHVISHVGKEFSVVDLQGSSTQPIRGLAADAKCFWSPNGQRIACVSNGHIALIDAHDPSKGSRSLGSSGYGMVWSPDSTRLLLARDCSIAGGRLEIVDVNTGSRTKVASAECRIATNQFGWLDRDVVR